MQRRVVFFVLLVGAVSHLHAVHTVFDSRVSKSIKNVLKKIKQLFKA